jgi:hypothetical protein
MSNQKTIERLQEAVNDNSQTVEKRKQAAELILSLRSATDPDAWAWAVNNTDFDSPDAGIARKETYLMAPITESEVRNCKGIYFKTGQDRIDIIMLMRFINKNLLYTEPGEYERHVAGGE